MPKSRKKKQNVRAKRILKKPAVFVLSLLLLLIAGVGGTLAFLATNTGLVTNRFAPSDVTCDVTEEFDGVKKTDVNVKNTGDTDAYIRVKLVSYRINDDEQQIGGLSPIDEFILGDGWFYQDGFYYYSEPVAGGESPDNNLADVITLTGSYNDEDGGKQVIEVMAEAIQARGVLEVENADGTITVVPAVTDAWGVTVGTDGNLVERSSTSGA